MNNKFVTCVACGIAAIIVVKEGGSYLCDKCKHVDIHPLEVSTNTHGKAVRILVAGTATTPTISTNRIYTLDDGSQFLVTGSNYST